MHSFALAWIDYPRHPQVARPANPVRQPAQPAAGTLSQGQVVGMAHPLGRVVVCERGCLWLSFDGDPRDVILHAGQQHRCDRDTRMTIEALDAAQLQVR